MKLTQSLALAFGLIVFVFSSAYAAESPKLLELQREAYLSSKSCDHVMRSDDQNIYIGYGAYKPRETASGRVQIIGIADPSKKRNFVTRDGVVDIATVGNRLFVLTYSALEEWDLAALKQVASYPTYFVNKPMQNKEHATGFYLHENRFYISHGRLGVSVFDITKNRVVDQKRLFTNQGRHESMVVDIAGIGGDKALLAVDNFTLAYPGDPQAYRGISVLDLKTLTVTRQIGGIDAGVQTIRVLGDSVILGFHPAIWKYSLKDLLSDKEPEPRQKIWKFPGVEGWGTQKVLIDEKYLYACFYQKKDNSGFFTRVPVVFERKELMLD